MKRFPALLVAALAVALGIPALADAPDWQFDTNHTGVHFKVRHLMVSSVRGDFESFSGKVVYDEKDVTKSSADISIDAKSINTRIAKRDEHLRSADFLDAAKFPTITYKSTGVRKDGDGLLMDGNLTLRGVTRPVTLRIEGPSPAAKGLDGRMHVGGSATARINRKDFGLAWNKALETGGVVVGDEVDITIDVELSR